MLLEVQLQSTAQQLRQGVGGQTGRWVLLGDHGIEPVPTAPKEPTPTKTAAPNG